MFCPECECEYVEGIKVCVDCNVELVKELPTEEEKEELKSQDEMVEISSYPGLGYGTFVKNFLEENEIPTILLNNSGIMPLERILVPRSLAQKAYQLISEFDEANSELNDDEYDNEYEDDDESDIPEEFLD